MFVDYFNSSFWVLAKRNVYAPQTAYFTFLLRYIRRTVITFVWNPLAAIAIDSPGKIQHEPDKNTALPNVVRDFHYTNAPVPKWFYDWNSRYDCRLSVKFLTTLRSSPC